MAVSLRSILTLLFALIALVSSSEDELVLKQSQHKAGSKKAMRASTHSKVHSKTHSKTHSKAKDVDDDDTQDDDDASIDDKDDAADAKEDEVAEGQTAAADAQVALKAAASSQGEGALASKQGQAQDSMQKKATAQDGTETKSKRSEDKAAEDDEDDGESDVSEEEVQKAKAELDAAKNAVLLNSRETMKAETLLRSLNDKAAQEHEIQSHVDDVASQTQSKALAKFLGDMWKEMRLFAKPFYKEHLEEKLEDLHEASPKLRKRLDEATSTWNKVNEEA